MEATGKTVHWIETPEMKVEISDSLVSRMALGMSVAESNLDMDLFYQALGHTVVKDKDGLEGDAFYHSILRVLPNGYFTFLQPRTLVTGPTQVDFSK